MRAKHILSWISMNIKEADGGKEGGGSWREMVRMSEVASDVYIYIAGVFG